MPTISDAFERPKPEDLHALGFVIKLREAAPQSAEVEKLARDYVVTPSVEREMPRILDSMRRRDQTPPAVEQSGDAAGPRRPGPR